MNDPFDLTRFVAAQDGVLDTALAELRAGAKRNHWMWFVFPQLAGLGHSEMARHYAIGGPAEARAYLAHPLLGPRLAAAVAALLAARGDDPVAIMGGVDAVKLRSSLTLFEAAGSETGGFGAAGGGEPFGAALDRFFGGERDPRTLALLAG